MKTNSILAFSLLLAALPSETLTAQPTGTQRLYYNSPTPLYLKRASLSDWAAAGNNAWNHAADGRVWNIIDLGGGLYRIDSGGKSLTLVNTTDWTHVATVAYSGWSTQKWTITSNGDGSYRIENNGKALTGDAAGATVKTAAFSSSGWSTQRWYFLREGWSPTWNDEFNGASIDTGTWGYEIGKIRNNEEQYYTDRTENARIENGKLLIECRREAYAGSSYTSASLNTQGKHSFKYGRIEMRAKLPYSKGLWPAFWTLGTNITSVGWPYCGEIDIMEMIGGGAGYDNVVFGSLHWYKDVSSGQSTAAAPLSSGIYADSYHLFAVEWSANAIKYYMDNWHYYTADIADNAEFSELHAPHYLLLNLAIGGSWPNGVGKAPDATTVLPQKYYIDYVRVYTWDIKETESLATAASSGDPHNLIADTGSSGGARMFYSANAANDYVIYAIDIPETRTYAIYARFSQHSNRGTAGLGYCETVNGTYLWPGSVVDTYTTSYSYAEYSFGSQHMVAGTRYFKLKVGGKNAASTGYYLSPDYIKLVPQ